MPCERSIIKEEGQSLYSQGITFLPPYATAPLFHLEGSVSAFKKQLFHVLVDQEPPYEEALDWLHFDFTGDTKGQYAAPAHTKFYLLSSMEGEPLFLPALERLQTFYPGAYARGTTSTSEGAENWDLNVKFSVHTHP